MTAPLCESCAAPEGVPAQCRCIVCARCGRHTGNATQGHYWSFCKARAEQVYASLKPGEHLSMDAVMRRAAREFHFCCPGNCELEAP